MKAIQKISIVSIFISVLLTTMSGCGGDGAAGIYANGSADGVGCFPMKLCPSNTSTTSKNSKNSKK